MERLNQDKTTFVRNAWRVMIKNRRNVISKYTKRYPERTIGSSEGKLVRYILQYFYIKACLHIFPEQKWFSAFKHDETQSKHSHTQFQHTTPGENYQLADGEYQLRELVVVVWKGHHTQNKGKNLTHSDLNRDYKRWMECHNQTYAGHIE